MIFMVMVIQIIIIIIVIDNDLVGRNDNCIK